MVASSGSRSTEEGGGGSRKATKKGPWTTTEDAMLVEYVRKNGEGNWNAVQRNCGLLRCGKSCRLRWANHLRPNLKKGSFSAEEERLIIELHSQLGNKWARMASQLPGRTDNEIKNYWNTRVKRHQRAGLSIYPDDFQQKQQQYGQYPQLHQQRNYHKSKFNPSHPLLDSITNFPTIPNPSQPPCPNSSFLSNPSQQFTFFRNNQGSSRNFSLPQSSSFSPSTLFHQSLIKTEFSPAYQNPVFQFRPDDFEVNPFAIYSPCNETELPSIQSPAVAMPTPATSGTTCGGDYTVIGTMGDAPDQAVPNSGLLDALLEESNALVQSENLRNEVSFANSSFQPDGLTEEDAVNFFNDSSSANSSVGMKEKEPILAEEMNQSEDDYSSLFNNFPLTDPVPPWYDASANSSNGKPSNMKEYGDSAIDDSSKGSHTPGKTAPATAGPNWSLGSGCWNNMPGIC